MARKTKEQQEEIQNMNVSDAARQSGSLMDTDGQTSKRAASNSSRSRQSATDIEEQSRIGLQKGLEELRQQTISTDIMSKNPVQQVMNSSDDYMPEKDDSVASWDTRLARVDAFFMNGDAAPVVTPFASNTIASTFYQLDWVKKKGEALEYYKNNTQITDKINKTFAGFTNDQYINMGALFGNKEFGKDDPDYLGTSSLMNPYCLTKLCGGLGRGENDNDNFMYDIRDQRRFYDVGSRNDKDFYTVSNPTVTQLIKWSNADKWGRTPYTFQDFVYLKLFGLVQNNRLLTLRRYHAPTYDNLNFPGMFGKYDDSQKGYSESNSATGYFAPRCTVVGYFGEGTDNQLSSLMSFSTGVPWEEIQSKVWSVDGEAAGDHQAEMDRTFESDGFGGAEKIFGGFLHNASDEVGKILSYGKFALALKKPNVPWSEETQHKLLGALVDPYESGKEFENRLRGPVNRIDKVQKRKVGLEFSHSLSFKTTYKAKAIGGINPKAAMLDILSNCMEMCSVNALWWGGAHRFMVKPRIYPWHDGGKDNGWRDSFMEKLYQGQIFGDDGAIAFVAKGIHNLATNNGKATTGADVLSNIQNNMKNMLGGGMAAIGSLISSISSSLFGEGSNPLSKLGEFATGKGAEIGGDESAKKGQTYMANLLGNLENLWRSKVIAQTQLPTIRGMGSLLIGEPVGEWHLTVGNPLNPIMVIGNLIVSKMDVSFSDELGPDDFPEEMTVSYTIMHGMARDKSGIQSMFNRGMGKIYDLPDYISSSSEKETTVDKFTGTNNTTVRNPNMVTSSEVLAYSMKVNGMTMNPYGSLVSDPGKVPSNTGNPDTQLITKFSPVYDVGGHSINSYTQRFNAQNQNRPIIRSLGITRQRD